MDDLVRLSIVRDLLERHGLRADKAFGQNFLVDRPALEAVAGAAELGPADLALEVGPGLGVLTRELAARAGRVLALELDARLLPVLAETVGHLPNVEVRHADALAFDLRSLPPRSVLAANLPYNVATPVLVRAVRSGRFRRLAFLVQREVGERLVAGPGSKAYGSLSVLIARHGRARVVRHVAPGCFHPPPEVTSSVVAIELDPAAPVDPGLEALVRAAFRHRRKTLAKNLQMQGIDRGRADAALAAAGLDPRVRAEAVAPAAFEALRDALGDPRFAAGAAPLSDDSGDASDDLR